MQIFIPVYESKNKFLLISTKILMRIFKVIYKFGSSSKN